MFRSICYFKFLRCLDRINWRLQNRQLFSFVTLVSCWEYCWALHIADVTSHQQIRFGAVTRTQLWRHHCSQYCFNLEELESNVELEVS